MSSSLLEELRSRQEEIEVYEDVIAHILKLKKQSCNNVNSKNNIKNKLLYENAIKLILLEIQQNAKICLEIYEDKDGMRKEENAYLAGMSAEKSTCSFSDIWPRFYDKIKNIKNYNKKFQQKFLVNKIDDKAQIAEKFINMSREIISEEELIFDLNEIFNIFLNLHKIRNFRFSQFKSNEIVRMKRKGLSEEEIMNTNFDKLFQEIDYVQYLKTFFKFKEIPRHCKYRDEAYENYLKKLLDYLCEFFQRTNPLANEDILIEKLLEEFEIKWKMCEIEGWEEPTHTHSLYCKVSDKLFSSQSVFQHHKEGKKYTKKLTSLMEMSLDEQNNLTEASKETDKLIAKNEFLIFKLSEILREQIDKSIEYLQKKQSKTAEELALSEQSDDETYDDMGSVDKREISDGGEDEEDDEKVIYNPLNLPIGWDGKPIAYWLYKLHGLGVEYKCEICGNYSYWGRRSFEKHFQEWRHSFGMRCLKIPNTIHFKEITKIEDAITLYEKLKKEADSRTFKNELEVECEDSQGNVMSIRDYNDLLKQGLL